MSRFETALGDVLLALCAAGLMLSWIQNNIAWHAFQVAVFCLLAIWTLRCLRWGTKPRLAWPLAPMAIVCLWGLVQRIAGTTIYGFATEAEVLRWSTYLAVLFLSLQLFSDPSRLLRFVRLFTYGSAALAALSLAQYYTSQGRIFWLFGPEGYPKLGPFLSYDHYCSFAALGLAMAVFGALEAKRNSLPLILAAALLYGSAIAGASRAGSFLLTLEIPAVIALTAARRGIARTKLIAVAASVGLVCVIFGLALGEKLYTRYATEMDSYRFRADIAQAALDMFRARPVTGGFGLGTWIYVYPQFAHMEYEGYFINAAHNDWLQWAGDGGLPMLAAMLALFLLAVRSGWRAPWALGAAFPFVHSLIDFPLQGRFLPCVVFLLLGAAVESRE